MGLLRRHDVRPERYTTGTGGFYQPAAGSVEAAVALWPTGFAAGATAVETTLADYRVRDFGSGTESVLGVLDHVLVNKFGSPRRQVPAQWHRTVVVELECAIEHRAKGQPFATVGCKTVADLGANVAPSPVWAADAESYRDAMGTGTSFPPPLYVSGAVLNGFAGRSITRPEAMLMLDGARRLVATALSGRDSVTIQLIISEDQLPQLLDPEQLEPLQGELNSLGWFKAYQNLPLVGLKGDRTLKRFDLMPMEGLEGQTVLDFGCNVGGASHKAAQAGAKRVVGIEGYPATAELAKKLKSVVGLPNLEITEVNFNDDDFDAQIDRLVPEQADYSFFFSVYRTRELTQRERLFRYILDKTTKGVFFEGHADPVIDTERYYAWLFDCFGVTGQYLGQTEGKLRPLFYIDLSERKA